MRGMKYWLFKSEPDVFGIDHLAAMPDGTEHWDGVRNYQARNFLRDEIKIGDRVLFYHSNAKPPGVVGLATVVKDGYPDHTAFDADAKYYDPKSDPDNPRWYMVDIRFDEKLPRLVSLDEIREVPELAAMPLINRSRLSVQPVAKAEFNLIVKMARS